MAETITGRHNPLLTYVRKLNTSRAFRREEGRFVLEGPKLLAEAEKAGIAVETVLYTPRFEGTLPDAGRVCEVPEELFEGVCDTRTPQGVLAVCRTPELALPEALTGAHYLVLDGVQDPGNLGTIWRTADAFGADALVLLPGCADPYAPKTVRSTMGAAFRLPVWECTLEELTALTGAADLPLLATALREDTSDVREIDLSRAAVIIGSEGQGISRAALEACRATVRIPMRERCESLNAAIAAGIVLWEMYRG